MSTSRRPSKRPLPPSPTHRTVPAKPRAIAAAGHLPVVQVTKKQPDPVGGLVRPTDLAALARSITGLQEKLAKSEAELERERRGRAEDADTIAEMLLRIIGLEKSLRETHEQHDRSRATNRPPQAYGANLEGLRAELAALTVDRDAADRQRDVAQMQHRAAEAKLALVALQLEWTEDAATAVEAALPLTSAPMRASIATLLERLGSARSALFTEEGASLQPPPPSRRGIGRRADSTPALPPSESVDAGPDSGNDSGRKRPSKRPR